MTDAEVFRRMARRLAEGRAGRGFGLSAGELGISYDQWRRMNDRIRAHKQEHRRAWAESPTDPADARVLFCLFLALECEDE